MKIILLLIICCSFSVAQNFLRKDIDIQWVKGGDLTMAREIFKRAYQKRYKNLPPEKLKINNFATFLESAFDKEERDLRGNPNTHLALAYSQNRLVGFVSIDVLGDNKVYLRQLAVSPDLWHQGIEETLVNSILEKEPSLQHILVIVRRANESEKAFYKNLGFQETLYMHEGFDPQDYIGLEYKRD